MLLIDGKHLRKRYVYPHDVSKVQQNNNHIWPYIMNTSVGEWEVSLSASPSNLSATGGNIKLTYNAQRIITYTWVNYNGKRYEYYKTQSIENGVCTLGTTFGKLKGDTLTVPSNPYNYERVILVAAHCGGVTKQIAITQSYGSQGTSSSYISFNYSTSMIPADSNGEAVSKYITITNAKGVLRYADGSIYEESLDPTEYSVSYSNTITSKNEEQTEMSYLCTITLNSAKYGSTSQTATVKQEAAPKPTIVGYGNWQLSLSSNKTTIGVNGDIAVIAANCFRKVNWSNGTTTVEQASKVVLGTTKGTFSQSSIDVSKGQGSTNLTIGKNDSIKSVNIVVTASCNNVTQSVTIVQEAKANSITEYSSWVLELSALPTLVGSSASTSTITTNCYRTAYWADGTTTVEQSTEKVILSTTRGSLNSTQIDVSTGADSTVLNLPENTAESTVITTITATCNKISKTVTVSQNGQVIVTPGVWTVTITASNTSLPQEGGTSTIYATCSRTNSNGVIEYSSNNISLSTTQGSLSGYSVPGSGGSVVLTMGRNDETYSIYAIVKGTCEGTSDTVNVHVAGGPKDDDFWQITYVAPTIEATDTTNTCTVMFSKFSADGSTVLETVPATAASDVNIGSISSTTGDNHLTVVWTGEVNASASSRDITFTATNDDYDLSGTVSFKQRGVVEEEPVGEWMTTGAFSDIDRRTLTNKASNIGFLCFDGANFTDERPLTEVSANVGTATITSVGDLCTVEWSCEVAPAVARTIVITGSNGDLKGTWKFNQGDVDDTAPTTFDITINDSAAKDSNDAKDYGVFASAPSVDVSVADTFGGGDIGIVTGDKYNGVTVQSSTTFGETTNIPIGGTLYVYASLGGTQWQSVGSVLLDGSDHTITIDTRNAV